MDKYFNNIQNPESRYYRRQEDIDDLVYDKYFNDFAGKTVFEAEILSEVPAVDPEGDGNTSTSFKPLRVRIKGIHTKSIPDPYDAIKNLPIEEQPATFRTLLTSHPIAYPDTLIYSDSAVSQPLTRGAIVEIRFIHENPNRKGQQRGLRYGKVIKPNVLRSKILPPNLLGVFDSFAARVHSVGDASWKAKDGVNMPEELSASLDSLMSYLSDAGFRGQITITSGLRSFDAQVSAMMSNLFSSGAWIENTQTQQGAVEWIRGTYNRSTLTALVTALKAAEATQAVTEGNLRTFLKTDDFWTTLTSHDTGNAADIKTRGLEYSEVALIESGLTAAKGNNGPVKKFQWEKMTTDAARDARKSNKDGVSGEHIHVTFKRQEGE